MSPAEMKINFAFLIFLNNPFIFEHDWEDGQSQRWFDAVQIILRTSIKLHDVVVHMIFLCKFWEYSLNENCSKMEQSTNMLIQKIILKLSCRTFIHQLWNNILAQVFWGGKAPQILGAARLRFNMTATAAKHRFVSDNFMSVRRCADTLS